MTTLHTIDCDDHNDPMLYETVTNEKNILKLNKGFKKTIQIKPKTMSCVPSLLIRQAKPEIKFSPLCNLLNYFSCQFL